jgi:queuine/archaeosine tRNA-ribosyltransferase
VVHGLLTLHNLKYMMDMMASIRGQILRDEI